MEFYIETLPVKTQSVLETIKQLPDLKHFYLSGGSALSLQLGHRESEDLDFFIPTNFVPQTLQQNLMTYGKLHDVIVDDGSLNVFLNGVKLQFLRYPYSLLEEFIPWNEIYLSSVIDIACTKLITISDRGSKKDFIDLYFILQTMSLEKLLTRLEEKYKNIEYNMPHVVKSLVYFKDADLQPMPKMHKQVSWEVVKNSIAQEIKKITF